MVVKRIAFWGTVAGVSVLANLALEVAAHQSRSPGLKRLAALTHLGAGGQSA